MPRPHSVTVPPGRVSPPTHLPSADETSGVPNSRRRSPPEDITFISGSAETPPEEPPCCPTLCRAWATYKAVLCYVVSCSCCPEKDPDIYLSCPVDHTSGPPVNGHPASSPRPRVTVRDKKTALGNSFSYPDVKIMGVPVYSRQPGATDIEPIKEPPAPLQPLVYRSSAKDFYSSLRDSDPELPRLSGSMSSAEIDELIWHKLTELFSLHQIDELARCTSETVFLEKSSKITELISSLTQDYQLEEQDAECRLVRGIIRISTRKQQKRGRGGEKGGGNEQNSLNGVKTADSGNESMHESGLTSQDEFLDVKISQETTTDLIARNLRRPSAPGTTFQKEDSLPDTETDSSGTPLLKVYC